MMAMLWLVPALPLFGAFILGLFGPALGARWSGIIGTASVGLAAALSVWIGLQWLQHPPIDNVVVQSLWAWVTLPGFSVNIAFYLDPVSLLMMLVITVVGSLIHLFSTEYMEGEAGYSRYFAYLNLFVAAMLLLVLADDLLVLFVGWEGVGVCSYLLVGFWFSDPENGYAARKSFVVTRIADIAMLLGLLLISTQLGTLNIHAVLHSGHVAADWRAGKIRAGAAANLAAGCHGGADAGERADPCGDDGDRRRVSRGPHACIVRAGAAGAGGDCDWRGHYAAGRGVCWARAERYQTRAGIFNHEPNWIHVSRTRRRRMAGGDVSFFNPCRVQGAAVSLGRHCVHAAAP